MTDQEQKEVDSLKEEIADLKNEIRELEDGISDLENDSLWESDKDEDNEPQFSTMIDQEKYDLFMDSFQYFNLEQFEEFLKTTKYVKI